MVPGVTRNASAETKRESSDALFTALSDYLFDSVNLLNNPGLSTSNGVTSTTTYNVSIRVPDTARGKHLRPDKRARFRTIFYVFGGAQYADAYILSPCLYPSTTSISSGVSNLESFDYYVGIKIYSGRVSLVRKSYGETREKTIDTGIVIIGDRTHKLEMIYNVSSLDIYLNDKFVGSISTGRLPPTTSWVTMYPVIAPIRSIDGTSVEMDFENYQYIQDK